MEAREGRSADLYVKSLGLLGLGRAAEARAALATALDTDPDNVGAVVLAPLSRRRAGPRRDGLTHEAATDPSKRPRNPLRRLGHDHASMSAPSPVRIAGLDAYRGLVLALMMGEALHFCGVAAAFPASALWAFLCHHQDHVAWVGCSLHDLIQPGFSFLVGAALPFSLAARAVRGQSRGAMIAPRLPPGADPRRARHLPALARPPADPLHLRGHAHPDRPRLRLPVPARPAAPPRPVDRPGRDPRRLLGRLRALSRPRARLRLGVGRRAVGLAAPPDRLRRALEQGRELLGPVRPLVPEPLPARGAVRLQRGRLPDAELHPHPRHHDPGPPGRRRPAQRAHRATEAPAGSSRPGPRASPPGGSSARSASAPSSSGSGPRASPSSAAAGASCSPRSSTG